MKRIICCLLSLIFLVGISGVKANDTSILRVGLKYGSTAVSSAKLSCDSGFSIGTVTGTTFNKVQDTSASSVTVSLSGSNYIINDSAGNQIYASGGENIAVSPLGNTANYDSNNYYGDFVFKSNAGKLTVINYVDIEDYVKGVLPYEMSASWPIEALKAQALCARSFAIGNLGKHESYGFDLCNTTNCQVYNGTGRADANSDAAVDQTKGQVLMADGKLAVGYYFASDGGATENNENVWGGTPISYLRGVIDTYEDASMSSNSVWSVTLTPSEVQQKMKSAGYSIGEVVSVEVTKRTAVDNVNEVTVTDISGKSVTLKNSAVRSVFGLNSMRYTITPNIIGTRTTTGIWVNDKAQNDGAFYAVGANGTQSVGTVSGKTALTANGKEVISASSVPDNTQPASSFTFNGTGWGHHVGMSQYGARSMALLGFNYEQILKFYYTGISISGK